MIHYNAQLNIKYVFDLCTWRIIQLPPINYLIPSCLASGVSCFIINFRIFSCRHEYRIIILHQNRTEIQRILVIEVLNWRKQSRVDKSDISIQLPVFWLRWWTRREERRAERAADAGHRENSSIQHTAQSGRWGSESKSDIKIRWHHQCKQYLKMPKIFI